MDTHFTDSERAQVLRIIRFHSPDCSDYQIWRGTVEFAPGHLYPLIDELIAAGLISRERREGYPHWVYAISDSGCAMLESLETRSN